MIGSLATLAGLELRETLRRNTRVALLAAVGAGLGTGASAYGLSAVNRVLAARYGEVNADLMIGAGLALAALLAGLTAWAVSRQRRTREARAALAVAAAPLALGLGRKLAPSLLKATPLVLLAGVLAGRALSTRD